MNVSHHPYSLWPAPLDRFRLRLHIYMPPSPETLKDLRADQAALVRKAHASTSASTATARMSEATTTRSIGPGDLERAEIQTLGRAKRGSGDNAENITLSQAKYQLWEAGQQDSILTTNGPSGGQVTTLGKLLKTASESSSSAQPSQQAIPW